jgi:hypothetical protein
VLRAQLQATPPELPPSATAKPSAASGPDAAHQTRLGSAAAPCDAARADSSHSHRSVMEAADDAGQHGWFDHVARIFKREAWRSPSSAKGDGGRVTAGPDTVSRAGQAAVKD